MRAAILTTLREGRLTPRAVVDRALVQFERAAARLGTVRPALLFAERDRIARELRSFVDGRLAARLRAQPRGALRVGADAAPFGLLVRGRRGTYAVVLRRLPHGGSRLGILQRICAVQSAMKTPVDGVLIYDFSRGTTLRLHQTGAQRVDRYLRAS